MKLSFENLQLPNLSFLHPSTSGPTVTANYMAARPPDLLQRASPTVLLVTIARNRAVLLRLIWIIWRQVDQRKFPNAMISSEYFRKLLTSLKALQTRLDLLFRRNASNTCAAYSLIQRHPWSAHCLLTLVISMVDLFTFFSIKFSWAYVSNKKRHHTCVPIRVHFIIIQMYLFGLLAMYVDIFFIRLFHHLSLLVPNVFSLFVFKRSFYFFFECADFCVSVDLIVFYFFFLPPRYSSPNGLGFRGRCITFGGPFTPDGSWCPIHGPIVSTRVHFTVGYAAV